MYAEDRVIGEKFAFSSRKNPEGLPRLREIDERLFATLAKLGITSNPTITERLMLLDTKRRSGHRLFGGHDGREIIEGRNEAGEMIEKKITTHLEHSLSLIEASHIFTDVFPTEWQNKYLPKIEYAAIVHDIGKTGPANVSLGAQKTFIRLFSFFEPDKNKAKKIKDETIGGMIASHALDTEKEEMLSYLAELGLSPDQPMSDIFGRHVDYTYQILKSIPDIGNDIIFLAASHHRGTRNYPYHLTDKELDDLLPADPTEASDLNNASIVLELADTYEAKKSRGEQKTTTLVLDEMRKKLEETPEEQRSGRAQKELEILNRVCDNLNK